MVKEQARTSRDMHDEVKVESPHINERYGSESCMVENKFYKNKPFINSDNRSPALLNKHKNDPCTAQVYRVND
jgi:hypothetical protein